MKKIISIEDIRGAAAAKDIELSGWNEGEVFVCKLRKPGLYALQMKGGVPNPVLATVEAMFYANPPKSKDDPEASKNIAAAMHHIARAALIEPTLDEIEDAGLELTDQQYNEIYSFVLGGAEGISRFRQSLRAGAGEHVEAVQGAPVGADGADRSGGHVDGGRGDHVPLDADAKGAKAKAPKRKRTNDVG